ncbi:MAG: 50S ribosomal protein L22 [Candidatus Melainabacteria bacterium RIFCSPHIGHO2_02_FULL_34_12]|nr:MAG: 50S ribosomal protein L22 [Candidatus Melainabacteria bacterium RIFCSPHIGHO2_02_FULL_34_12]
MAKAIAKYIRMSPRKLRRVIDVIRGKDANSAQTVLKFMSYAAARVIEKVLKSAVSNAKENNSLNPNELKVTKAYVDQSTTLKRWRAVSRGRGFPILKRTSHVTIEVNHDEKTAQKYADNDNAHKTEHKRAPKTTQVHDHKHDHKHDHDHEHPEEGKHTEKAAVKDVKKEEKKTKAKPLKQAKKDETAKTKEIKKKKDKKEDKE